MYDKFKIHTREFTVRSNPKLSLGNAKVDLETGERGQEYPLWKTGNQTTLGLNAFKNTKNCSYDITPYGLFIEFNPSKFGRENNISTANQNQLQIAMKQINVELNEIGISTNINNNEVSRLDLTKDINTNFSVSHYIPVFENIPRATTMRDRKYPSGFLIENTQREYCIYDKLQQIQDVMKINPSQLGLDNPIMRLENRLLNKKVVQSKTGLKNLIDFISKDNYNHCKEVYNNSIESDIFSIDKTYHNISGIDTNTLTGSFSVLLNKAKTTTNKHFGTNRAIDELLKIGNLENWVTEFGSIGNIVNKLTPELENTYLKSGAEKVRKEKAKLKKRLQQQARMNFYLNNTTDTTTGKREQDLYFEIKEKFLRIAWPD